MLQNIQRDHPSESNYRKFNFYTTKYFEGWDLYDFNATIIIVSDIHSFTLKSGISNKCVQAAGRNRYYSNQIIHITNSRNDLNFVPLIEKRDLISATAYSAIIDYNNHSQKVFVGKNGYDTDYHTLAKKYSDFNKITNEAYLNKFKVDQIANIEYTDQEYNHSSYILKAWENAGYHTSCVNIFIPRLPKSIEALSKTNRIKVTVEFLEASKKNALVISQFSDIIKTLPINIQPICKDYLEIGGAKMEELEYNSKLITEAVLESINKRNKVLIREDYYAQVGTTSVLKAEIADCLQALYKKYNKVNPKTGNVIKAYATDLEEYFTEIKNIRIGTANGLRIVKY